MSKIVVIRHAKSDWYSNTSDFERVINKEGQKSCKIISQELNAQVIVNSNLVNQTNQQIFETLEKSLNEFINNQSWTNREFLNNEKITCSFIFTL